MVYHRISIVCLIAILLFSTTPSAQEPPYGIDTRATNTALVIDSLPPSAPGSMQLQRVFPQLSFSQPVLLVEIPDSSGRLAVVQKNGLIRVFPHVPDPGIADVSVFLDISAKVRNSGEQGLLGLAFDPDYSTSGEFYVYYSWNKTSPGTSTISRFTADHPLDNSVDPSTEEVLLEIPQPYGNHNGGMLAFGPDNMLYIAVGDGGSGGDPLNSGQDTRTLLGNILRIDVMNTPEPGLAYRIPPDNPFIWNGPQGTATRKEIFAYGFRNPWRFSFDQINGFLIAGDVGQSTREEIDAVYSGGNYGWRLMEGTTCFNPPACDQTGLTLPIADYGRSSGASVTGGYVYFGSGVPELYGFYIYGDYVSGNIWGLRYDGSTVEGPFDLALGTGLNISGFGQDASGEVYVLDLFGGGIYVLDPVTTVGSSFPNRLSDIPALLNAGMGIDQTAQGIIPYQPGAQLWSDGAKKERMMAVPYLDKIGFRTDVGWDYPENTTLIKNFVMPDDERNPGGAARRIETRLLYRKNNQWHGFSYEWNDEQTDAYLLWSSKRRPQTIIDKNGQTITFDYLFPARSQCTQCHTNAANGVLGLNTAQMNADFRYPASGVTDNQLRTYDHIQLFTAPLPDTPDNLPRMPDPLDLSKSVQDRARAYLAANCAMCHRPGGPAPTSLDLRWGIGNEQMNAIDTPPGNGDLGVSGARIISAGNAGESILLIRVGLRDQLYQMPPLATFRVDTEAYDLLSTWINSLQGPEALTQNGDATTPTAAVLRGRVNPLGADTVYYFEYGSGSNLSSVTTERAAGDGTDFIDVSETVIGLQPDAVYSFRIIAENMAGTATGATKSFTTRFLYVALGDPPSGCDGNSPCFPGIDDALSSLAPGAQAEIRIDSQTDSENLVIGQGKSVILSGGWDANYANQNTTTTLRGRLEILVGTCAIENLILQP